MKILVCVKQVPDSEVPIYIDEARGWIDEEAIDEFKMNRLDEYAVEEALLIKESLADTRIDVITVGPDRCKEAVRRAIGMGVDSGIHIRSESDGYESPGRVADAIANFLRNQGYSLILTGAMSEDAMQGQVGPMLAARLGCGWATSVIFEKIASDRKSIYVEREIEGGHRDMLELNLPAVITIQSGINTPRWPSLSNLLRANSQELEIVAIEDFARTQQSEHPTAVAYPEKSRAALILSGSRAEKATRLLTVLREKSFL
ncbi:MAG: electron transfer flavoprotein subunit beta/FixA family protein [Desulfobacterales bacterium]|jgi:electron transfer flavoprotein beta subunit